MFKNEHLKNLVMPFKLMHFIFLVTFSGGMYAFK